MALVAVISVVGFLIIVLLVRYCRRRAEERAIVNLHACPANVKVAGTAERGMILITQRAVPRGTEIFRETALLTAPEGIMPVARFAQLPRVLQSKLLNLHCSDKLPPARPEDGGVALSQVVGENGEWVFDVLRQCGFSEASAKASVATMWQLLRVWSANKISISNTVGDNIEQAIFATISRMNHSCEPNVRLWPSAKQDELVVVATTDIAAGDELCICYPERNALPLLHFLYLPIQRRQHLLLRWGFDCACERCAQSKDVSRTFRCTSCGGDICCLTSTIGVCACSACGYELSQSKVSEMVKDEEKLTEEVHDILVQKLKASTTAGDFPIQYVADLLQRCIDAGLSKNHWMVVWLLTLVHMATAGQRGTGQDLGLAATGVALAARFPGIPPDCAKYLPESLKDVASASSQNVLLRPGLTRRLEEYVSFDVSAEFA